MPEGFPELFLDKLQSVGTDGFKLIEAFVSESKAEDLYLDFKRKSNANIAALNDDDKKNLSKAMSGFANSAGGIIVWGVIAERGGNDPELPDVAKSLAPIKNLDAFHSNLNDLLQLATKPTVAHARNVKVSVPSPMEGYVVTYVPEVENPPYRAEWSGRHYYKRAGSRFYEMEPFDIRDVVSRGRYPKIEIQTSWSPIETRNDLHLYELEVVLTNRGPSLLDSFKFEIDYPVAISARAQTSFFMQSLGELSGIIGNNGEARERATVISHLGLTSIPLFPNEVVTLFGKTGRFHLPYKMTDELYQRTWKMNWRFYADGPPMQEGTISIVPGSYQNY
jgi:hypothetical protein